MAISAASRSRGPFTRTRIANLYLELRHLFPKAEIVVVEHHVAHAASAFYASPFEQATILTLDHAGDFRCGSRWQASGNELHIDKEWYYPDSLGRLYGAVTQHLGYRAGADEHKVQWLSTSGDDRLAPLFREIASESARIDESFFDASGRLNAKFAERVTGAKPEAIARGLQKTVEETVIAMAGEGENLALAGGLFLNALLVDALERSGRWKKVHVQPAAGNAGTAMGAAYYAWHQARRPSVWDFNCSMIKGPSYSADEIKQVLENCKLRFQFLQSSDELVATAVRLLGENKIIAWMQGPMEFGPRALGNRSILASPLNPYSTENLNVFIKHREPFRKFAASVPEELASTYFDIAGWNASNLATVSRVKPEYRKTFESAILGDDMVRVHTVSKYLTIRCITGLLHEAGKVDWIAGAVQHQLQSIRRSVGFDAA